MKKALKESRLPITGLFDKFTLNAAYKYKVFLKECQV